MLKISKLADYGTALMVVLAQHPHQAFAAKDLATTTHIALPTVSKLLKMLARAGLLESLRGPYGGYLLALAPEQVSVAKIIAALEGEIAITQCTHSAEICTLEKVCFTRKHWWVINETIRKSLEAIHLGHLCHPPGELK